MKMKEVKAETTSLKIKSIENTAEKSKVRQDYIGLINQHLYHREKEGNPIKEITSLSLPAESWFFEKGLLNSNNTAFYRRTKPTMKFDGVDWGFQTSLEALENMPENSTITGSCSFEDFLKYETIIKKNGYSRVNYDAPRKSALKYYNVWADFCNDATLQRLKDYVNIIRRNIDMGFAGITVKLSSRKKGSCKEEYIGRFKGYCNSKDRAKAIEVTINKLLHNSGYSTAHCVYSVQYPGGEAGRSRMLTLIYAVNIPKQALIPIREDRTIKSTLVQTRKLFVSRLRKNGRWDIKLGKQGRKKGKAKKILTPEEKRVISATGRWEKVWGMISREKKMKVASKYGKSLHSFGSMIAHYHGELRKKKILPSVVA